MTTTANYPIVEHAHAINGVPGRMHSVHAPQLVRGRLVHRGQKWVSEYRDVSGYGTNGRMHVEIRFDDECKNGHQTFAITATIYTNESRKMRDCAACGCLHEDIAQVFPELAPLIRWHLMSTDSPMHYVANTIYHARDTDSKGYKKGDPCEWETVVYFADSPIPHLLTPSLEKFITSRLDGDSEFRIVAVSHKDNGKPGTYQFQPKYTFAGFNDDAWHKCPFDEKVVADAWAQALNRSAIKFDKIVTRYSEGKERDFNAARSCAVWPDATDEQLSADPETLKAAPLERLPAMVAEFRAAMENAGLLWEPVQPENAAE